MRKIEREPHGRGRFVPGQDLVVAGCIGKAGTLAAMEKKKKCWRPDSMAYFWTVLKRRRRDLWICPRILRILA
ncbi:MAG: hypothetical protein ACLU8D_02115 [Enterocloster sp.]